MVLAAGPEKSRHVSWALDWHEFAGRLAVFMADVLRRERNGIGQPIVDLAPWAFRSAGVRLTPLVACERRPCESVFQGNPAKLGGEGNGRAPLREQECGRV